MCCCCTLLVGGLLLLCLAVQPCWALVETTWLANSHVVDVLLCSAGGAICRLRLLRQRASSDSPPALPAAPSWKQCVRLVTVCSLLCLPRSLRLPRAEGGC